MIHGATLRAAFRDAQRSGTNISMVNQIAAYVCLSCVQRLETICVLQAFSPLLFTRGSPQGPDKLLKKLHDPEALEEIIREWIRDSAMDDKNSGKTLKIHGKTIRSL